jgi:hypothetical protein
MKGHPLRGCEVFPYLSTLHSNNDYSLCVSVIVSLLLSLPLAVAARFCNAYLYLFFIFVPGSSFRWVYLHFLKQTEAAPYVIVMLYRISCQLFFTVKMFVVN